MKVLKKIVLLTMTSLLFFACGGGGEGSNLSVTDRIADADGSIDFKGKTFNENVVISEAITVKNLTLTDNTITVNAPGVVLEKINNAEIIASAGVGKGDLTLKDCEGITNFSVQGGGSNSIHIDGCEITAIEVEKEGVRFVLESATTVTEVKIKVDGAKIQTNSDEATVTTLSVSDDVANVDLEGGNYKEIIINVETGADKPTITITGTQKVKIENITEKDETGTKADGTVKVTEEAVKAGAVDEVKAAKNEIKPVNKELVISSDVETQYEKNGNFNYNGLNIVVTYSDGTYRTIPLTADNCVITGFNPEEAGIQTIIVKYEDITVGTFTVYVIDSESNYKTLIDDGWTLLQKLDIDAAINCFNQAYKTEPNDETAMYYALAQIASISVDENIQKLAKENFGIVSFPNKLNALISSDWLKEYYETEEKAIYEVKKSTNGSFIRVSGTEVEESYNYETWELNTSIAYKENSKGDLEYASNYLTDVKLDNNGKYFIYTFSYYGSEDYTDYLYERNYNGTKKVLRDYGIVAPEFKIPTFADTDPWYTNTLLGSTQTSYTVAYLMLANLFSCNPKGFNGMVDNILAAVNTRLDAAIKAAESMTNASVTLDKKYVKLLGLDEYLGDSTVKLGKAELDIVIASMEIIRGAFQMMAATDLSLDLTQITKLFENKWEDSFTRILNIPTVNTLGARSQKSMDNAKASFVDAINRLNSSYTFMKSEDSLLPAEVREYLDSTEINTIIKYANSIKKTLEATKPEDQVLTIKIDDVTVDIDLGKIFTAGYFANLIEKNDEGGLKLIANHFDKDTNIQDIKNLEVNPTNISADLAKTDVVQEGLKEFVGPGYFYLYDVTISVSVNLKLLTDVVKTSTSLLPIELPTTENLDLPIAQTSFSFLKPLDSSFKGKWYYYEVDLSEVTAPYDTIMVLFEKSGSTYSAYWDNPNLDKGFVGRLGFAQNTNYIEFMDGEIEGLETPDMKIGKEAGKFGFYLLTESIDTVNISVKIGNRGKTGDYEFYEWKNSFYFPGANGNNIDISENLFGFKGWENKTYLKLVYDKKIKMEEAVEE